MRLNVHLKYHEKNKPSHLPQNPEFDNCDNIRLFRDAVIANNVDAVRAFISEVPELVERALITYSAPSVSHEMLELLLEAHNALKLEHSKLLPWAVRADHIKVTQILFDRGAPVNDKGIWAFCCRSALRNKSPEMIKTLVRNGLNKDVLTSLSEPVIDLSRTLCSPSDAESDAKYVQCLSLLDFGKFKEQRFVNCFHANVNQGCSVAIAKFLLENGVDVKSEKSWRFGKSITALYRASYLKSRSAAELMRFLLESGANPDTKPTQRAMNIADRPGPKNIAKWFGIPWEQLVEESRKKYATDPPEEIFRPRSRNSTLPPILPPLSTFSAL